MYHARWPCSLLCILALPLCHGAEYLRIRDYAPKGCFSDARRRIPAYNFTETFIGAGLKNLTQDEMRSALERVADYASRYDKSGLVVSYQILEVGRDPGALVHTDSTIGETAASIEVLNPQFHGVRMVTEAFWSMNSTKINESDFDTVASQQAYAALFQIAANFTLRENWVNDMRISPESAPIWARLPLGNLTGHRASIQLDGPNMYPFTSVKQHIFMSALFEPLQAVCNVVTADLTEVYQSTRSTSTVNATIAFTICSGECVLDKGLASALANQSFLLFMASTGLPVTRAIFLWAKSDYGVSVLEQAAQAGYPSSVYQPSISVPVPQQAACPREVVLVLSSVAGLLAVGFAALTYFVTRSPGEARRYDRLQYDRDARGSLVVIGAGNFGKVYVGRMNRHHRVAIKTLKSDSMPDIHRFEAEVRILQELHELPHIVKCYPYNPRPTRDKRCSHLVMELMEGGDLSDALHSDKRPRLEWSLGGRVIALQIALGVAHLHERKVVHCDLKPKNILLNRDWTVAKIGDVGLARMKLDTHLSSTSTVYGTFLYAAPEVLLRKRCDEKVDIFSLGMLLSEMLSGQFPDRYHLAELMYSDVIIVGIIQDCRQADPSLRPTARQVYDRLGSA